MSRWRRIWAAVFRSPAHDEGILVGVSPGASLAAIASVVPQLPDEGRVLTLGYDSGERYLSVEALFG